MYIYTYETTLKFINILLYCCPTFQSFKILINMVHVYNGNIHYLHINNHYLFLINETPVK